MEENILITPPAAEPVSVSEMIRQLGLTEPSDVALNLALTENISGLLLTAREDCEDITRTHFITQTWLYQADGWPCIDGRYHIGGGHYAAIRLPKPPLQSIEFMQYVDTNGTVQPLLQDTSYGSDSTLVYGYQLDKGADSRPARLLPPWARPWPPIRRVANAVMVQYKCGYGGPVTASMAAASLILAGPVFLPGDVGQNVTVPGAGASVGGTTLPLRTTIASVDENGQATLAAQSVGAVAATLNNVWVGKPVPEKIRTAIKLLAQFYYQNGSDVDLPTPRIIDDLLEMYRNRVS